MELFELTKTLINFSSPTGHEQEVAHFLKDYLAAAGFIVEMQAVHEQRQNVYARWGDPLLVFSTHMDTVLPHVPMREEETYIYGRGACDAKGIIAAQIKAAEKLRDAGRQDFGLLFLVGEETGGEGARVANTLPNRCRYLINGEPTENLLALGSKGSLRLMLTAKGRAAHSAYPHQGESAILKLLEVLQDLRHLALPSHPMLGESTFNIGTINGGVLANVIPDFAQAELMFRVVSDLPALKARIAEVVRERVELRFTSECAPVFMEQLQGFATTVVAFTTDIPWLTQWGKPLLLGPGSILDAHTPDEKISKAELERAVALYYRIAEGLVRHVEKS